MENDTLPVFAMTAGMGVSEPVTMLQAWARVVGRSPGDSGLLYVICTLAQSFAGKQSKRIPSVKRILIHGKMI